MSLRHRLLTRSIEFCKISILQKCIYAEFYKSQFRALILQSTYVYTFYIRFPCEFGVVF